MAKHGLNGWTRTIGLAITVGGVLVTLTVGWMRLTAGQEAIRVRLEQSIGSNWCLMDQTMFIHDAAIRNPTLDLPTIAEVLAVSRIGRVP